jgi:RNA polymerase sigma-70 factor (ECF subfamily)
MAKSEFGRARKADSELAALTRQGDLSAYGELMRRYFDRVYRVACTVLQDADSAADAAQECFVQAYLSLPRYDVSRPFRPWIMGIAGNCAVGALRKQKRLRRGYRSGVSADPDPDPSILAAASDLRAALCEAIAQLPARQQMAIRLFAVEGAGIAEVAETMGCAVGTVKSHLHRARTALRELLADRLQEDQNGELQPIPTPDA